MNCALLDIGCHVQGAAWEWWSEVGLLNKALIIGGLIGIIIGVSWSLIQMLRAIGGWPAALGAVAIVVGFVLAILPKKPKGYQHEGSPDDHRDAKGPFEFGVNKQKAKQKRDPLLRRAGESVEAWWGRLAKEP